jgi:hypothetical protein
MEVVRFLGKRTNALCSLLDMTMHERCNSPWMEGWHVSVAEYGRNFESIAAALKFWRPDGQRKTHEFFCAD